MKSLLLTALFVTQLWSFTSAAQFKMSGLDYTARTEPSGCPSQAQVTQEIANIYSVANSVRIYSLVDCNQGALILQAIKDLNINLRVALGIWLDQYFYIEFPNEYAQLIALANSYGLSQVDYVIVGSETQYRNNFSPDILISYIQNISTTVKTQLGYPNIKVTTADVVQNLIQLPQIISACDVVAYNQFSFWEGVPVEGAVANNQNWYNQAVQAAQGKPVLISEVGWLYQGPQAEATASNVNTYIQNFVCWASPAGINYFYFSAYDALWQADDDQKYWGIFDENNQLKAGISLDFPCSAPAGVSTSAPLTSAPTTQMVITTQTPTTMMATTQTPTTVVATTQAPTTPATTQAPTAPTTPATTQAQTTVAPTTAATTQAPTNPPTSSPTTLASTTVAPTSAPSTTLPTNAATTAAPTMTAAPTSVPTNPATSSPTSVITSTPIRTLQPTTTPSATARPTNPATSQPTQAGTTVMPTSQPTTRVTSQPTTTPSAIASPTNPVTSQPTQVATTMAPITVQPTSAPTNQPTQVVTSQPTSAPTQQPTSTATEAPTSQPTSTSTPSSQPTTGPTSTPSSTSTTVAPTRQQITASASTQAPTSTAPAVTSSPTSDASRVAASLCFALMIAVVAL